MKCLSKNPELCIKCRACEEACSKAYFKENNRGKSRIRIGENKKIVACTQCGECIDICPVEALYRDGKGIVRLNKNRCVGCFMCVGFCPELAMFEHEDYTEPFNCVACGICVNSCPTEAIYIEEK
ncbi:4Fe-4S binding protein [Clostridium sp. Cult3]|uniref:4Fe-4S binding protein n=1 Tax=Clostridium sp. Cult3 TaxID=2079004 RepID=UPI001F3DEC69|nr:4Fe-4S binding protein [Clostridium sp. Cult3]MCF6460778.1 aldehyde:ferredoxin oxidoreductase [Clostridium sp. Cult3]